MRVVLDTNIFISGIHWNGPSSKILMLWILDEFDVILSEKIIEEVNRTLNNFKIMLSDEKKAYIRRLLGISTIFVKPEFTILAVQDDPDDDKFVEAAVAGAADYIITQDKHLLKIKQFEGIRIVTPEEFLKFF